MSQADLDRKQPQTGPLPAPVFAPVADVVRKPVVPRGVAIAALAVLLAYVATRAPTLYREGMTLREEWTAVRTSEVVGYPGIQPNYSFAQRPPEWHRVDGDRLRLWSGWRHGKGHQWFGVAVGDVDPERLSPPEGRDVNQAIDRPVVELGGGPIWGRIPIDSHVAAGALAGVETAYPLIVLQRVYVVNDEVGARPFLVTFNPRGSVEDLVTVYEPVVDGERLLMGVTGYFHDNAPMLYDRKTESLWVRDGDSLRAVAGAHRGRKLREVSRAVPVSWDAWRQKHPGGRLVVGAERTPGRRF